VWSSLDDLSCTHIANAGEGFELLSSGGIDIEEIGFLGSSEDRPQAR